MRELTLQACRTDPRIRSKAIELAAGLGSSGPVEGSRIIEEYLRTVYTLVDEPEELLVDPIVQMDELETSGAIHGDCDDVAMMTAALLYMIGLETRFKAILSNPDGSFQHVFAEFRLKQPIRWCAVDPTVEGILVYPKGDFIVEYL